MMPQPVALSPRPRLRPLAAHPALLLPVRIEACFELEGAQPELWVRIFPDQIVVDGHDPRLTEAEVSAGRRYWRALWRAGTADEDAARRAWRSLVQRFGATRAGFLAHAPTLVPTNLAQRPAAATPGGADPSPPPDFPPLSAADRRPASPAQAPRAFGLPERWTVTLIRGGRVAHRATSGPVRSELAVGPDPATAPTPTPDGLKVDDGVRWMVDFEEALDAGMALRVPITPADAKAGFDRVLVYGLTGSGPEEGPAAMRSILDAHRFTDGFALVPQGAATNNTSDATAAYTRTDPGSERSFGVEAGGSPRDGQVLADFLGLPPEAVERVEHAERTDQENAREMTLALWPATLGYFLEQMMSEVVGKEGREEARAHVLELVRGRGLVPAIRIGQTPYGIVVATSLAHYKPRRRNRTAAALADLLRRLWPVWSKSVQAVPHVQPGGDHDAQLIGILGMDASSRAYRTRHVLGEELLRHTMAWLKVGEKEEESFIANPGKDTLAKLGYGAWDPRLIHLALSTVEHPVPFPIVVEGPTSETEKLPPVQLPDGTAGNYISWLRQASLDEIRNDGEMFPGGPPGALLYQVLRHGVLIEYGRLAWRIVGDGDLAGSRLAREAELVGFAKDRGKPTVWDALAAPMPGEPGKGAQALTVAAHIADQVHLRTPDYRRLWELLDSLDHLAGLPTAELERLFTETIDTYSHRIDPWITSLALDLDRARQGEKREFHLGAYGWMEDLRPRPRPPHVEGRLAEQVDRVDAVRGQRFPHAPPPRRARVPREGNAGFIHAPSLQQAQVGAVLRNGYLTHRDTTNGELLAVDISSERTRVALDLLEGIRQGQPLKALLGYRFERELNAAGLQVLVQPFRDRFPLLANQPTEPPGPVEAVAASNVVDGVSLHAAWKEEALWPGGLGATPAQQTKVNGFIADLDDVLDALGDVSIGESVFQIMRGNPVKAGGMIDAISRGERPPDPEFVRTPRDGLDLTHRIALLFTPGPVRRSGWPGIGNPRAEAEPRLDAWVSTLLPKPAQVRCRVRYERPAGPGGELPLTLDDLDLGPLDAVALAAASPEDTAGSELVQRLRFRAQALAPADAVDFEIVFKRDPAWGANVRTFPELLVVAEYVHALLAGARALAPQDLLEPERPAERNGATLDNAELDSRAAAAMARIDADVAALEAAATAPALREALIAGSLYGVPGGIPGSAQGVDPDTVAALEAQATALAAALRKRHDDAVDADAEFDRVNAAPEKLRDHLVGLLRTLFGDDLAVCPRFQPAVASELGDALAASASLLDGDGDAPERWLAQLATVRGGAQRWQAVREGAQLLSRRNPPPATIAQMPPRDPDRWLALPLVPGKELPPSGRVSIVAEVHPAHDPAQPHCGLILDEWPERIPAVEQSTGLAFHFDQPSARAPQALVMAVCPDEREFWDEEALESILVETLDLAKARAVDLESLSDLGQLLPSLLFPFNADGETVSLQFEDLH